MANGTRLRNKTKRNNATMAATDELKAMIMSFRCTELQSFLQYMNQPRTGRKQEMVDRVMEIIHTNSTNSAQSAQIEAKIRELYKLINFTRETECTTNSKDKTDSEIHSTNLDRDHIGSKNNHSTNINENMSHQKQHQQQRQQAQQQSNYIHRVANFGLNGQMQSQHNMIAAVQSMTRQISPLTVNNMPTSAPTSYSSNVIPSSSYMPLTANRQNYTASMYNYANNNSYAFTSPTITTTEVEFKHLPFYDFLSDVLKPIQLVGKVIPHGTPKGQYERNIDFSMSPQQVNMITNNLHIGNYQVLMRFGYNDWNAQQDDNFPQNVRVKINESLVQLPNTVPPNRPQPESKRPGKAINITCHLKLCPGIRNIVNVMWTPDSKTYVLGFFLVKKLEPDDLLERIRKKGIRDIEYTSTLIKEKLTSDDTDEITTAEMNVSLLCPLSKLRMDIPCRSTKCTHVQCFDAKTFLLMNEKKPSWNCPVCNNPLSLDSLFIDGYFSNVLKNPRLPKNVQDIKVHKNGGWTCESANPSVAKRDLPKSDSINLCEDTIAIDDDDDVKTTDLQLPRSNIINETAIEDDVICLSDDEGDKANNEINNSI